MRGGAAMDGNNIGGGVQRHMAGDAQLLAEFRRSHTAAAFAPLYRASADTLYRMAYYALGGRRRDAEDAVQETWCRALAGLAGFRGDSGFRTWLCAILVNVCIESATRRERRRETDTLDAALATPVSTALADVVDAAQVAQIAAAMQALPLRFRAVLVMHDVGGYTHAEIAAALGIETGTSKSQLARARERLLERLATPHPQEPVHD
jgi:RNA polymerase sigma-70 factor (ECF subfamily)